MNACGGRYRIGARQLIDRDARSCLPIQAADRTVILSSEFHASYVFDSHDSAI